MRVKDILKNSSTWMPGKNYLKSEDKPIVSVLLPTFRRAQSGYFELAVQSVLNQTLKNIELIIIDDCSTDGTFELIKHFMESDERVSCIRHKDNIGLPAISEHEGYIKARGKYISFIFDDNEWEANYLDKTINYMVRTKTKASYGIVRSYYGENSDDFIELGGTENSGNHTAKLISTNFIANGGVVLHREVIENVGLYDPHLSLTRLCDWDLWRRISCKYRFEGTGIYVGKELGAKLSDSLGNTVLMNSWVSLERMSLDRDFMLLPEQFENVDIVGHSEENSQLFLDNMNRFISQYTSKKWYKDNNQLCKIRNVANPKLKRVIVMSSVIDATLSLSFARLHSYDKDIIYKFVEYNSILDNDLIYASAIVFVRNVELIGENLKKYKSLGIRMYYYADDNFKELAKENTKDKELIELSKKMNFESLLKFSGIFVSSQSLLDYFTSEKLHENIILLEPSLGINYIREYTPVLDQQGINIAFMGGKFRNETFYDTVLPSIKRLSKVTRINLFIPKDKECESINTDEFPNLLINPIERTLSLDMALFKYGEKNIHILIHCGPQIKNNLYKTENSLINATQMGAVLIVNEILPYINTEKDTCVITKNDEISWYNSIKEIIENENKRRFIYNNALQYCTNKYNPNKISKEVSNEFSNLMSIENSEIINRYDKIYYSCLLDKENALSNENFTYNKSRSLINAPICFSKLIKKKRTFKIVCNVENLSEIGICFDSFSSNISGNVNIKIMYNRKLIREVTFNLDKINRDNWTYIKFNPIKDSLFRVYSIELDFEYDSNSDLVGVFEDRRNRNFIYRLSNKIGYPIKLKNILFVDCRS